MVTYFAVYSVNSEIIYSYYIIIFLFQNLLPSLGAFATVIEAVDVSQLLYHTYGPSCGCIFNVNIF